MSKLRKIILAGLLLAASIVLGRFLSIRTPIVTIGFSFVATILSAMLLGPAWTVLISGLSDILGALMFPTGAYFPGYTLTAVTTGLIYGLFLNKAYKRSGKSFLWRLVVACVLVSVFCNLGLNTLWIWITTKKAIVAILPTRLIKEPILIVVKIVIMQALHLMFMKSGVYKRLFKNALETEQTENDNNDEKKESSASNESAEAQTETLKTENNSEKNQLICKYCNAKIKEGETKCQNCGSSDFVYEVEIRGKK